MNKLGKKIKMLRKKAGLTQQQLSCDVLTRPSLSKIENGTLTPSLPQLQHIAAILNINLSVLLTEDLNEANISSTYDSDYLETLFSQKNYFQIIDFVNASDFISHYYLGMSYYKIDLKSEALKYLEPCEDLFNKQSEYNKVIYVDKLAFALNALRRLKINRYSDEINYLYLKKAIEYLEKYKGQTYKIYYMLNNNVINYFLFNNDYKNVIEFATAFLRDNMDVNSPEVLAYTHINLSNAYFYLKNYDDCIIHLKKSIFFFEYISLYFDASECYINLFNAYIYRGDYNLCQDLLNHLLNTITDQKLIEIYKVLELNLLYNTNKLNDILKKAPKVHYNGLRKKTRTDYYFILGRTSFLVGNYSAAERYYKNCINSLKEMNRFLDISILYKNLYSINDKKSNYNYYIKYKNLYLDESNNPLHPNTTCPQYFDLWNEEW